MAKVKKAAPKNPKTKAGTEITPEVGDALAAEAEQGYDSRKRSAAESGVLPSPRADRLLV